MNTNILSTIKWDEVLNLFLNVFSVGLAIVLVIAIFLAILKFVFKANLSRLIEILEDDYDPNRQISPLSIVRFSILSLILYVISNGTYLAIATHSLVDVPYMIAFTLFALYAANQNKASDIFQVLVNTFRGGSSNDKKG